MRGIIESTSVHLLVFLGAFLGVSSSIDISQNHEKISVKVGEEGRLLCSTTDAVKACTFRGPSREPYMIWKGASYENRIKEAGESPNECGIQISSFKEEDNGVWTCVLAVVQKNGNTLQGQADVQVTVVVPPSDLKLYVDDVEAESSDLQMKLMPDAHKEIKCSALNARPAPTFEWRLNDEVLHGSTVDSEEPGEGGKINYSQTLSYYPDPKHNGLKLKCVLTHEAYTPAQIESADNEKGLTIKLLYKPLESEKRQEFYVQGEGQTKTINMVIEAFPEPTEVYWVLSGMESPLLQGAESLDQKYKSSELSIRDTSDEYSIYLTINGVSLEDTKNESYLFVRNSEGETEYKFKITLGQEPSADNADSMVSRSEKPEKGESLGSGPVVGVIIIVLVILILIGIALLIRSKGLLCFAAKPKKVSNDAEKAVEGSDTESAEDHSFKESSVNKKNANKASINVSGLFAAVKSVAKPTKDCNSNSHNKTDFSESKTSTDEERRFEKGTGDVTYADLDKSALSQGSRPSLTQNDSTEYAEIQHNN